jgi:hypothetical protein
MVESLTKN